MAYFIGLAKKPHNVGETLRKPCMLKAFCLVLGEANRKEWAKIFLSDSTVKTRIDEIAVDIKLQVLEKINKSCAFAIQCDETLLKCLSCWFTSALLGILQLQKKCYFANPCKRLPK